MLSKVFKSEQWIPAEPCRLEPVVIVAENATQPTSLVEQAELNIEETAVAAESELAPVVSAVSEEDAEPPLPDEQMVERMRQEAEAILESARREAELLLEKAQSEADVQLAKARETADSILNQAREEAEALKETSRQTGLVEGRGEGLAAARTELEQELAKALAIVTEATTVYEERLAASEAELVKLAAAIAEKIIAVKMPRDGKGLRRIIGQALTKAAGAVKIKIRLHPDDLAVLEQTPGLDFQEFIKKPKTLRFEADPGITGGCFIETEMGQVDARVSSQLERIVEELVKVGRWS